MPVAAIKFTQGVNTDLAGRALVGVTNVLVVVTNGNNTGVSEYKIELLDVPFNSALTPGVLVDQVGMTPTANFTPDVPGTYQVKLTLNDDETFVDVRDFIVPNARGWLVPALGTDKNTFNYAGQQLGWKTALSQFFADANTQLERMTGLSANRMVVTNGSTAFSTPNSVLLSAQTFNFQSTVQVNELRLDNDQLHWGTTNLLDTTFAVSPESTLVALPGSICRVVNGEVYVKENGTGNTGWGRLLTSAFGLGGDVTGSVAATRVEALSGDTTNEFVAFETAVLRAGTTVAGGAYAESGRVRVSNEQPFSIKARDQYETAGTDDISLLEYDPQASALSFGSGTVATTTTSIKGTTLRANYIASFRIQRNGNDAILFTSSNIEIQKSETANVTHQPQDADVAPTNFELVTQAPFAGATTDANATPGKLILRIPSGYDVGQGENRNSVQVNISNVAVTELDYDGIRFKEQGARVDVATSTSGNGNNLQLRAGTSLQTGNTDGGHLQLRGGGKSGSGQAGSTRILSGGTASLMLESFESTTAREVLSFLRGSVFDNADAPTGNRIIHIGNASTEPTSAPTNGRTTWSDSSGRGWEEYPDGNIHRTDIGGISEVTVVSADATLSRAQWKNGIIICTFSNGAYAINFPNLTGRVWFFLNNSANTITVQTSGQTSPPTVAAGASVVLSVNGGNVFIVKRD